MQRAAQEEVSIEALRKFVAKWGAVLGLAGSTLWLYFETQQEVRQLRRDLDDSQKDWDLFRRVYRDSHAFGPGGFTDPQIRTALEASIREYLRTNAADMELRNRLWRQSLFDLNPTLKRPSE